MILFQPLDIVLVNGRLSLPHHPPIMWRSLDRAVHCLTIADCVGNGWSPEFSGIKRRHVDHYRGRSLSIHRYRGDVRTLIPLAFAQEAEATGYDFRQWLGFILGIPDRDYSDNSRQYTCSEFPYRLFQEHGFRLTNIDEALPLPRLFRYHQKFETIFDGIWQ